MKRRLSLTSIKLSSRNRRCEAAFTGRMYRSSLDARDKGGAIVAVVAIHLLLLFVLLHLSGKIDAVDPQVGPAGVRSERGARRRLRRRNLRRTRRQKPEGSRRAARRRPMSRARRAPSSRHPLRRRRSGARRRGETPAEGTAVHPGAAAVAGPGTGAGGSGNGTGTGTGNGSGSGDGGQLSPPQLVTPVLRGRDFPRDMLDQWPRGTPVFLRLRVDPQGNVSQCIVDRGTGVAAIDSEVCSLVYQRLHFRPALNRSGQAVAGWFGYGQTPPR